jgi:hypothetical protein
LQLQRRKITKTLAISVLVSCYFLQKYDIFVFIKEVINLFSRQADEIEKWDEQIEVI